MHARHGKARHAVLRAVAYILSWQLSPELTCVLTVSQALSALRTVAANMRPYRSRRHGRDGFGDSR